MPTKTMKKSKFKPKSRKYDMYKRTLKAHFKIK